MVIEFFRLQTGVGTASLDSDGKVVFSSPELERELRRIVIVVPHLGTPITPEAGEKYLEMLPYNFRGPYFHCKRVD